MKPKPDQKEIIKVSNKGTTDLQILLKNFKGKW
jgi:hypothetical protein